MLEKKFTHKHTHNRSKETSRVEKALFPHPSPAAPKGRSPRVNNKHRASFIGEISPKRQIKKKRIRKIH